MAQRLGAAEIVIAPRPVSTASVPTTLSVWAAACQGGERVQFSLVEEQRAAHRDLARNVVQITCPHPLIERVARRVVSVTHHLHLGLERGASLRFRKAGTFRSAWHVDLLQGGTGLCSWPVEQRTVDDLDALDLALDRLVGRGDPGSILTALGEHMRDVDSDLNRQQLVDELIRQNLEMSTADLLKLLEDRGLLDAV